MCLDRVDLYSPVEACVRRCLITIDPPDFDDLAGLMHVRQQRLVQAVVSEPAAEELGEAVLLRFGTDDFKVGALPRN